MYFIVVFLKLHCFTGSCFIVFVFIGFIWTENTSLSCSVNVLKGALQIKFIALSYLTTLCDADMCVLSERTPNSAHSFTKSVLEIELNINPYLYLLKNLSDLQ